jgi:hypothetical protein
MKKRKRKFFSPVWMCGLRSASALITSMLLISSQTATAAVDERQPSAAEIVQPVAKAYQELQQALAGPPPKVPLTPDQTAAQLDKLFPMLEQAEKQIPRDTFDPQPIVDKIGKDPRKIFEWVRDNTYFVPYRGLLRGDKGVLMDRLGNSLDRAMLLYALLGFVNQPARMVRGTLTEAQASEVLAKVRPFPSFEQRTGSSSSTSATEEFVKQYVQQNHLDPVRIRRALDDLAAQQQRMKGVVQKRVATQAKMISAMVGPPPANAAAEERAEQVKAVTDHWWVQWQNAGKWTDFDPTLPDEQPGQTLTAMHGNVSPKAYTDVGEDLVHTVQIQVVIEVWKQGQVKEVPVLTHKVVAAEVVGQPIALQQIPLHWPTDQANYIDSADKSAYFKKTLLDQNDWAPMLTAGGKQVIQTGFDISGQTKANAAELGTGNASQGLGQSVSGILGGTRIGHEANNESSTTSILTAEWLDYESFSPGQPSRTARREIFDVLGKGRRASKDSTVLELSAKQRLVRALALIGETKVIVQSAAFSPQFVQDLTLRALLTSRSGLASMLQSIDARDSQGLANGTGNLTSSPTSLYRLALARQTSSASLYIDRPNVLSTHNYLDSDSTGALFLCRAFDLVANDVAMTFRGLSAHAARLQQGVLDTNLEAILATGLSSGIPITGNAAEALLKPNGHFAWEIIRSGDDPSINRFRFNSDDFVRAREDLNAGYVIVVQKPDESSSTGSWWRVDPHTGQTIGIGPRGWGQAVETQLIRRVTVTPIVFITLTLACYGAHAVGGKQIQEKWDTRIWIICPVAAGVEIYGAGATLELGKFIGSLIAIVVLIGYSQ